MLDTTAEMFYDSQNKLEFLEQVALNRAQAAGPIS